MSTNAAKKSGRSVIASKDLFNLRIITAIALSPDEKKVAYTVERMDEKENKYFANLWIADRDGSAPQQFTFGNVADRNPVWSPDGTQICFQSTRDKKSGIYVISANGGSEKKIIEIDGSIDNLQWSPNGKHFVFSLRYNDSHFIADEEKKKSAPTYRLITRLLYRLDGVGYLPQDKFQIYALEISSGKLRQITRGKHDNINPCLSPDGNLIAFVSNRVADPDMHPLRDELFTVPFKGGKEKRVPTPAGPVAVPSFSPDSKWIAYVGHDNPNDSWGVTNVHIWKVAANGRGRTINLLKGFDRMVVDQTIADTADVHDAAPIFWSRDGKRIYFISSDTGNTNCFYVPARGGKPTRVFGGRCHVKAISLSARASTLAIVYSDLTTVNEIIVCPAEYRGDKQHKRLTNLNDFLSKKVALGATKEVWFKGYDGTDVQGFLATPPGFSKRKKYPAILMIHGGPRAQYGFSFFHEMNYLAGQGFVVLYTNIRGGSGRGETWADAITGGWGDIDYKDCMAAADYLETVPGVDRKRVGVGGGSYGGYMTNWIIGHTNRFKAAVTMRSICDLRSFIGSSDIGFWTDREFDGYPWTNKKNYEERSPITYFKNVRTPVLISHSERDLRCHIEQAEQMFAMLKILGKKVEMVRFPEEFHGLSRHGRPDRRIARLEIHANWFAKYLKKR
jgi:dipeptidyl aminopeptidase/acylaminoacyl peptidase